MSLIRGVADNVVDEAVVEEAVEVPKFALRDKMIVDVGILPTAVSFISLIKGAIGCILCCMCYISNHRPLTGATMKSELTSPSTTLLRYSRQSLWLALGLLTILATGAVIFNFFGDTAGASIVGRLLSLLPLLIVIALATMRTSLGGASTDPRKGAMSDLLNDEWRLNCLNRSCRNALFAISLSQPILALALGIHTLASPTILMASATAFVGAATLLVSMLVYDR